MKTFLLVIAVVTGLILSSCCKTVQCKNKDYFVGFELNHYDSSDFTSLVVRKFKKNSQFNVQYDSVVVDRSNCLTVPVKYYDSTLKDTVRYLRVIFNYGIPALGYMTAAYDYEIFITPINSLSKVTDIYEPQSSEQSCSGPDSYQFDSCVNPIEGYVVNGKRFQATASYQSFNKISIDK